MSDAAGAAAGPSPRSVAERVVAASPTADRLAVRVADAAPGEVALAMTVTDDMVNGYGICHGGVVFTLAELACLVAASGDGVVAASTGATIELVSPAPLGTTLVASSRPALQRGRTGVHDVAVTTDDGTVVALLRGRTRVVDHRGPQPPSGPGHA